MVRMADTLEKFPGRPPSFRAGSALLAWRVHYKGANDHTVPLSASGGRPDYFNSSVIIAMITVGMM